MMCWWKIIKSGSNFKEDDAIVTILIPFYGDINCWVDSDSEGWVFAEGVLYEACVTPSNDKNIGVTDS